jgi:predicted nuclease of restriction endonuclease-like (RecB) superfamily
MYDANPNRYASLLGEIKQRIRAAQLAALRQVNRELVSLYADIGRMIVSRQEGETWGKSVVASLARDLQAEFPGAAGFSTANLWRMKLFHETYGADEKLAPLVREIAWSHNVVILEKCKDPAEREFYVRSTRHFGWTRNVLVHQIENRTYHKTLLNQTQPRASWAYWRVLALRTVSIPMPLTSRVIAGMRASGSPATRTTSCGSVVTDWNKGR